MKKMFNLIGWKAVYGTLIAIVALVGSLIVSYEKTPPAEVSFGALSGPDIQSPYIGVGGLRYWSSKVPMIAGTSTPCTIFAPRASSTLIYAGWDLSVPANTVTGTMGIHKGITATNATDTFTLSMTSVTINRSAMGHATTTELASQDQSDKWDFDGKPNDKILFDWKGTTTATGLSSPGSCSALFLEN